MPHLSFFIPVYKAKKGLQFLYPFFVTLGKTNELASLSRNEGASFSPG